MERRLLEGLEQRHLGMLGQVGRIVDDDDVSASLERPQREVLLHLTDLFDGDVLAVVALRLIDEPRDLADVRMQTALYLPAGEANPASARHHWVGRAVERLRQPDCQRVLPDRPRTAELVSMGHVAADRSPAKPGEQATLPDHISHGTPGL